MKIIDTTTFFEEDMMMGIRFNILNQFVDKFIVCESLFTHSGKKKKINFNLNNYPEFKNKIIHIIVKDEPCELIKDKKLSSKEKRLNSIFRIRHQRNFIKKYLNEFSLEDFVIYSDNDEIPNLEQFNFQTTKKKYIIFNQKMFYYKFNLGLPNLNWFGSKACKLKDLKSIDFLRNIKNREYSFFRIDTLFSDIKQNSVEIINNGGWHFSNLKNYVGLKKKYLNDENHAEYELNSISIKNIINNIERRVVPYNHLAKKNSPDKYIETSLEKIDTEILPKYLKRNIHKFKPWVVE
jgi:beta-1,4-mannosyl-glycoprotein beta-1,4-N-acetylglucosaminyltransferase